MSLPMFGESDTPTHQKVYDRDDGMCVFCSAVTSLALTHATPLERGGTNELRNLLTCCTTCVRRKGQGTAEEYLVQLGFNADGSGVAR